MNIKPFKCYSFFQETVYPLDTAIPLRLSRDTSFVYLLRGCTSLNYGTAQIRFDRIPTRIPRQESYHMNIRYEGPELQRCGIYIEHPYDNPAHWAD